MIATQPTPTQRRASFERLRARTLQLFDVATSEAVLARAPLPGFRPTLWHLAHIGAFEGYWILQRAAGQPSLNPQYDAVFDPIKTPRESLDALPSRAEMQAFLAETRRRVDAVIDDAASGALRGPLLDGGFVFDLVLEHERQHQETLACLLQALPLESKIPGQSPARGARRSPAGEIVVPGVSFEAGADGLRFAYDNERPRHRVEVRSFAIDRDMTTNAEYAQFVDAGGYHRREWWSPEGWAWRERANVERPLYWDDRGGERRFFDDGQRHPDAPVSNVSWYEAEAYACFAGKRLPTEFEWEAAAAYDPQLRRTRAHPWGDGPFQPQHANAALAQWGTSAVGAYPAGDAASGMHDPTGNVWQWTSSEFQGYPGFVAYPYPEYSQAWFDGDHRVARGGSWYTWPDVLRTSFRNFFRRDFRLGFIGIRCARDS